jgi:hypothetical protein
MAPNSIVAVGGMDNFIPIVAVGGMEYSIPILTSRAHITAILG